MQVGAGGAVELDYAGMLAVAVSAHGRRRARVHGRLWAPAGGHARIVRQQHQVSAVWACERGSGLVMYKC